MDLLLTGLPRSGTTLVCHLLSSLPDVVALHEPMRVGQWAGKSPTEILAEIDAFIVENRRTLLEERKAVSKHQEGRVPDNPVGSDVAAHGLRSQVVSLGAIEIQKQLPPDFTLAIKHNAAFTALLEFLVPRHACYAIVRNPLAVLSSWQSVDLPVHRGRIPAAEALVPPLKQSLSAIEDTLERQLFILDWFFARFQKHLPPERIVRYEEVVQTRGACLQRLHPDAAAISFPLESRNQSQLYKKDLSAKIGERLLASEGSYWNFYSKEDVQRLLEP